jgi:hypothetical protein
VSCSAGEARLAFKIYPVNLAYVPHTTTTVHGEHTIGDVRTQHVVLRKVATGSEGFRTLPIQELHGAP